MAVGNRNVLGLHKPYVPIQTRMREDEGFKFLLTHFPNDALEWCCPEVIAAWGQPSQVNLDNVEVQVVDASGRGGFMDLAVCYRWPDDRVLVLYEHWSRSRSVDLYRVNRYVAELLLRQDKQS